jgi:hypothetical protein
MNEKDKPGKVFIDSLSKIHVRKKRIESVVSSNIKWFNYFCSL